MTIRIQFDFNFYVVLWFDIKHICTKHAMYNELYNMYNVCLAATGQVSEIKDYPV